ncbi:MAG: NnrU family protein [Myxococcales bacterium]
MLGFIYSVASYLGFLATFVYFAWFSAGVAATKTVNNGTAGSAAFALAVDLGLVLLFGLQHSLMARAGFKRVLTRVVPVHLERATYVLVSTLALALLMWQWRPLSTTLWHVANPSLAAALWLVNGVGWVGVPVSSLMIDHFDLFGLKPAFNGWRRSSFERRGFVSPLLYRYVRHPMMSSLLIGLWVTPEMTVGHLLLSLGMSAYIVIGVHFEERALIRELGQPYVDYRATTPRFLPWRASVTKAARNHSEARPKEA